MALFLKKLKEMKRSAWLYYPDMPNRSEIKVCSITVVRPRDTEESVKILLQSGLQQLAEEKCLVLCFPNPKSDGWTGDAEDIQLLAELQGKMDRPEDTPVPVNEKGIPTYAFMMSTWHPMNDTHYYIGIREGASLLASMAMVHPQNMAAMLLLDGKMPEITQKPAGAPVPAWLCGCDPALLQFAARSNGVVLPRGKEKQGVYKNAENPACRVIVEEKADALSFEFLKTIWETFFSKTRRMNTSEYGDCADRTDLTDPGFCWFVDNTEVDGRPHTWLVHVPEAVRTGKISQVPIVFFYHGGSDNPSEAAEMSRFHEIGEKENFITVYPWGSNRAGWNMELLEDQPDDLSYCRDLIFYMLAHYPVDPSRVYLSGFSNGAGMAQTVAMIYPERIAALGHIDSNWPGMRFGRCEVELQDIAPMRIALEKKKERDLFMPVWYTYGTREASSPVCRGCSQQYQYDFWKQFNHIEIKPTRELEDLDGPEHGVDGDTSERISPDRQHPRHYYTIQHFFTSDEQKENYYNFALMHEKGHEVAPKDALLAWNYMKQFRRREDGSVERIPEM